MALAEPPVLVDGYRAVAETTRQLTMRSALSSWDALGYYDGPAVEAWAARVAPLVDGASAQIGALTDAYVGAVLGESPLGVPSELLSSTALRDVDAEALLRRGGETVWTGISDGQPPDSAISAGRARIVEMIGTNLQLSHTHSARYLLGAKRTTGYQRVPRGSKSCALCLLASTQRYHSDTLMPIHPGCHCAVLPFDGPAYGHVIDPDKRDAVYDALEAQTGSRALTSEQYKQHVVVHNHGEIGPVLYRSDSYFTGPHALKG